MTTIKAAGSLLTANVDERVLSYLLLPYGEIGRTSAGKVTASAGTLTIPESITANLEHDGTRPVARSVRIEETERGLEATFRILPTTAGNDLLVEAAEGVRTGISVEIDNPVIRAGALLAGDLTGAGFVTSPAFPSAQLVACDCGDVTDTSSPSGDSDSASSDPESVTPAAEEVTTENQSKADAEDAPTPEEESPVDNTSASAELALAASRNGAANKNGPSLRAASNMIASGVKSGDLKNLTAALTDIPSGGVGGLYDDTTVPQYLGELWSGRTYTQRFAPLVSRQPLQGKTFYGWRFTETPTVGDWAGFPNQVPSSDVETEIVTGNAQKLAGGWVLDRDFVDLGNSQFVESFLRHATNDYARKIDQKVITRIGAESVAVSGTSVSGIADAAVAIVRGALNMLTDETSLTPEWAIVGADLYEELLLTKKDNTLEYLSSAVGLDGASLAGFQIVPDTSGTLTGSVVVGSREAITLFELPGSPVRVDALDVARGGVELGLYGYYGLLATGKGLVKVTIS